MNYQVLHKKYLVDTYPFRGKVFVNGDGNYLIDEDGDRYLDLITNYGVNLFGYGDNQITNGLKEQFDKLTNLHGSFVSQIRAEAAQGLVKRCGGKVSEVYFSNSGAEAVEAAVKFALQASDNQKIITAKGAYHGKTMGALSLTHANKYKKGVEDLLFPVQEVLFGDIDDLEAKIDSETAAVILEPIQGESGIIVPPEDYLTQVRELCNENSVYLILDEIQTGVGRTGRFLAAHNYNVEPDILCLGKGLAGGLPVGATLVSEEIAEDIPKLSQTSTFGGNPLVMKGAVLTLERLNENVLTGVDKVGRIFKESLKNIRSKNIKEVRGTGLMLGVEVTSDRNNILKRLQENKMLAGPAGDNVVRFLPPYTITQKEIDHSVEVLSSEL